MTLPEKTMGPCCAAAKLSYLLPQLLLLSTHSAVWGALQWPRRLNTPTVLYLSRLALMFYKSQPPTQVIYSPPILIVCRGTENKCSEWFAFIE